MPWTVSPPPLRSCVSLVQYLDPYAPPSPFVSTWFHFMGTIGMRPLTGGSKVLVCAPGG